VVGVDGGLGRFVLVLMVVERGMQQGLGLFKILVSYNQICYIVLCIS
jgi:hypothetical protein